MLVERIAVVGTGLIGGSFALALREAGFSGHLTGVGRNPQALERAQQRGIVNDFSIDLNAVVPTVDLIFLAVPVGAMAPLLDVIDSCVRPDTIVTDAGSTKQSFISSARKSLANLERLVPAHPIAGTEHSGVESGFASLYQKRRVIVTPLAETARDAVETVVKLWEMTGAIVEKMDPQRHDEVFAATSHLPHLLAFTLVETLHRMQQKEEILRYAAGGFADFTRIASSDPVMWRDVCLHNREALLSALDQMQDRLGVLREAISTADAQTMETLFQIAKQTRDLHIERLNAADHGDKQ